MRTEPKEDNKPPVLKPNLAKNKKLITFYHMKGLLKPPKNSVNEENTKAWVNNCLCFGDQTHTQQQNEKISLSHGLLSKFANSLHPDQETSLKGVQTPSSNYHSTLAETQYHSRCKTQQFQSRVSHSYCKTVIDTHLAQIKLKSRSTDQKDKKNRKVMIKLESKKPIKTQAENRDAKFRGIGKGVKDENSKNQ